MKIFIPLALLALISNGCSSIFYSMLPRHGAQETQIQKIETGKTQYKELAEKLGAPSRIGHKSNGHTIRIYRYISPYPGSFSTLMIETDQREVITYYEYYRTNDDDLGANQGYGRNHVFTTRE